MPAAPLPPNEVERLDSLFACSILDTSPEPIFDNISKLAADLLDTPIALVSLVDAERQWFKSAHGVDVSETPRDWAFCAYAILQDKPFVVTDAANDPRTCDNPLVTGAPYIRFYAGAQLVASDGHSLGTLCVIDQVSRDVTSSELETLEILAQQASALLELNKASVRAKQFAEQAQSANLAKSEFLANMSHEIRTPMNAIVGLTKIVLQSELNDLQRNYLTTVSESAESLLQVINDILDFSKIEAGKLEVVQTDFQVRHVLGSVLTSLALKAHSKSLELMYRCGWDVPDVLVGDPGRLRQILLNLIGNAVKFTESGHVLVDVHVAPDSLSDPSVVVLEVSVEDTGIGIDAEKIQCIFNEFEQADTSTTRRFGGTGLGLSITSRLVSSMNGEIAVSSQPERGSTFCFTAELGRSDKQAVQPWRAAAGKLDGARVLVVDDQPVNLTILKEFIGAHVLKVDAASSGAEALLLLDRSVSDGVPYCIVVSDVNMPGMDGYALAGNIRQNARLDGTPIILLTSFSDPATEKHSEDLKIAGRVLKPVKQWELLELMVRALGLADTVDAHLPQTVIDPPTGGCIVQGKSLRILLAEDSVPNQKLALAVLRGAGHQAIVAETGWQAVNAAAAQDFDLVLMDIQMPEMDGYQATAAIREREEAMGRYTPIIAMTAYSLTGDRERCLEAGMDDYVSKPVRNDELFAAMNRVLGKKEEISRARMKAEPRSTSLKEILEEELVEAVGGDREMLVGIVSAYAEEIAEVVPRINLAFQERDAAQLCQSAHKLKNAMRYFQLPDAVDLAQQLENCGATGDLSGTGSEWEQLQEAVKRLQPVLEELCQDAEP